jgi:hypothetical protein
MDGMTEASIASPIVGSGAPGLLTGVGDMTGTFLAAPHSVKLQRAAAPTHINKFEISSVHGVHCDKTQVHTKDALQSNAIVVVDKVATSQ